MQSDVIVMRAALHNAYQSVSQSECNIKTVVDLMYIGDGVSLVASL